MYPLSPKLPSHPGCHITLNRVPCATQRSLLVIHFKYSNVYISIPYMYNLERYDINELIKQKETHRLREQTYGGLWGKDGGKG